MISDFLFHQRWSETFFVSAYQQLVSAFRFSQRFSFSSAIFFSSALISGYGYHYQRWSALLIPITADQRWRKRKSLILISSSDFISADEKENRWSAVTTADQLSWSLALISTENWPKGIISADDSALTSWTLRMVRFLENFIKSSEVPDSIKFPDTWRISL